jgi:DNA primase
VADSWDFGGGKDNTTYSPEQVEAVLDEIGVEAVAETTHDYLCYCPFHGNRFTPSFSVSRDHGAYICYNAACAVSGSLVELVMKVSGRNEFAARRVIITKKTDTGITSEERIRRALAKKVEFTEFSQAVLDRAYEDFWQNEQAQHYMMVERGFEEPTLRDFKIGYSDRKNLVMVPMYSPSGLPIGVIGRSTDPDSKVFKNSVNLPTSKTLWNMHRAKRTGDTVIITEASFDAMRVYQAGYPNVVACLGGHFSPHHFDMLDRTFSTIILMTDFDKKEKHMYNGCKKCFKQGRNLCVGHNPGRDLGAVIAAGLHRKKILWASYDEGVVYPHDAKDAGDMTDDEIRQCLKNAVSNFEYANWGLY